jgi:hypothetical protein
MDGNPMSESPAARWRKLAARTAVPLLAFSSILLLLLAANGFSVPLALIFAFLSLFFVIATSILLEENVKAYRKRKLEDGLAEFFYRVSYYKSRKGSYFRAVDKAVQGTSARDLRQIVDRASRGLKLGGSLLYGIASGEELKDAALLKNLRLSGTGAPEQMRVALASHELHLGEMQSAIEESSQRYALINMFISTILPSFLVFTFIGTAILSQASINLLPFSVSLLIFIPLAYAVGNSLLSRRLYA